MAATDKLYDAFGELIYVLAMSDGVIEPVELAVIEKKLAEHEWGQAIKWSFDYEVKQNRSLEELYKKVIIYCERHGPDSEYAFLIEVLEEVAHANAEFHASERKVLDSFVSDLTKKFKADIERINKRSNSLD
ncbi:MAG: TerB family tellurite resistance protein [Salibacteraceae bacterium]